MPEKLAEKNELEYDLLYQLPRFAHVLEVGSLLPRLLYHQALIQNHQNLKLPPDADGVML